MREIETKSKELQSFVNYRLKDEDIDFIVAQKKKFNKDSESITAKKMTLLVRREKAEQIGDTEEVKEIDAQIDMLDVKAVDKCESRIGSFNKLAYVWQIKLKITVKL